MLNPSAKHTSKHSTYKIAKQCNSNGIAQVFDFGLGKVQSGNVKHSFATAHDDGGTLANVPICAIRFVHVRQNCQTTTAGKWAYEHQLHHLFWYAK